MKMKLTSYLALLLFLVAEITFAQQRTVSGVVSDSKGLPLPGVSVVEKGTTNGTQTDLDGKYSINTSSNKTLVFSFIGMKTKEVIVSGNLINVKLEDDSVELEGIVVTAFGIKRNPRDLGYAVSSIKAAELTEVSEPDVARALNGKVPGVNVNVSTGVAGAANQITIRGVNTLNGNTQPLIIVDGIAYSNDEITTSSQTTGGGGYQSGLSSIDPNDIASMTVLKSIPAAALYGSRAVNGVIVITTKSGSSKGKRDKKLGVSVSSGTYFENIANLPEYQNSYGAGSNFNYASANGSWGPKFGTITEIPTWAPILAAFPDQFGPTVPYVAKPNNVKDLFTTGIVNDQSVNLSYGSDEGSFNLTLSDLNQNGYIPFNTFDRTSISTGGTFKLKNGITVGSNMSYTKTDQVGGFFGENQFDGSSSSFARAMILARNWDFNLPYKDPLTGASVTPLEGQFDHPLWSWENDQIRTETNRTVAGFNLAYSFNKNISASYRLGYNRYELNRMEIRDINSRANGGVGSLTSDEYTTTDLEQTLLVNFDYELTDNIALSAITGTNILNNRTSRLVYQGNDMILPEIFNMRNVETITNLIDSETRRRNVGFFGDLTLSYKNYWFLNFTARNDISSTLPKNNNSYFYPSFSTSLILTDMFKIQSNLLNFAKLRFGIAKAGRDASAEFLNRPYVIGNPFNGTATIRNPDFLANPQITPEFTTEIELGTDLEFFKRKVILDFTVYQKTTTDLLTPITVPGSSGYAEYNTNVSEMINKGVEIGLNLIPLQNENFKWNLFTTFTKNVNEVTALIEGLERYPIDVNQVAYVAVGQPFGVFYGTRFARDEAGNYLINPNGGGIIQDPTPGIIGDPTPDFKMSFINSLSYKGFTLRTQFDWRQGGDIKSSTIESLLGRGVTRDTEDRERTFIIPGFYGNSDGTPILDASGNKIPNTVQLGMNELYFSPNGGNTFAINSVDEASIYDGTVFRLREASLTYDVPKKWLDKTPFGAISFAVIGSNLWYHAPNVPKYTNFDPEVTSFGGTQLQGIEVQSAPTAKRYGFKLNLTF